VSRHIAHYPIRMRGTFCGSLAHADPASEWCLVAATLDAEIHLINANGTRMVAARDFFTGAMSTSREADELMVEARLPLLSGQTAFGFYEFNRRGGDFALGMSLATFELRDGRMADVRVGIGGIEEMPGRLDTVEALLEGEAPDDSLFEAAGKAAADVVDPLEDPLTSADYRRDLTAVVVRRALQAADAGGSK
jgi:carbon-monoxide dehydrogenase medium subunit